MDHEKLLPLSSENILQLLKNEFRLTFNKKGQDYFALCPFRPEKSSSFAFEPEKKIFKCFAKQEIKQLGYWVGSEEDLLEPTEINQEKKLLSL
ncbi:1762_t:CDS:2, partial [Funneliformis geosporum]